MAKAIQNWKEKKKKKTTAQTTCFVSRRKKDLRLWTDGFQNDSVYN